MIFVFTGDGKGKTSSALGMALRAIGAGKKVLLVQFLKTGKSSENKAIKKLKNFESRSFGRKGFFLPLEILERKQKLKSKGVKPLEEKDSQLAKKGFNFAKERAESKKYHLLILDEINLALDFKLLSLKEVLNFLKKFGKKLDIILTGRNCPQEIINIADLVTELKEKKHYYQKGEKPRLGIEF